MPISPATVGSSDGKNDIYRGHNKKAYTRLRTLVNAMAAAINAGAQVVNSLTADAPGRGVIQAGYFDAATVALKFAAGCFAANSTIRALFAAGLFDSATVTSVFAAASIPSSKLATTVAPATLSGPGAIDSTKKLTLFTSTGAGNALTLADGTYAGQVVVVHHTVKGASGTGVITPTNCQHTSVTLTAAYDSVEFVWTGATWAIGRLVGATAVVTG
jgi:hypothetical protein